MTSDIEEAGQELPKLPEPQGGKLPSGPMGSLMPEPSYSPDQMRAYGLACFKAGMLRAAEIESRYKFLAERAYRSSDMEPPHWIIQEFGGIGADVHAAIDAARKDAGLD